jgi:hypothetical protein
LWDIATKPDKNGIGNRAYRVLNEVDNHVQPSGLLFAVPLRSLAFRRAKVSIFNIAY